MKKKINRGMVLVALNHHSSIAIFHISLYPLQPQTFLYIQSFIPTYHVSINSIQKWTLNPWTPSTSNPSLLPPTRPFPRTIRSSPKKPSLLSISLQPPAPLAPPFSSPLQDPLYPPAFPTILPSRTSTYSLPDGKPLQKSSKKPPPPLLARKCWQCSAASQRRP